MDNVICSREVRVERKRLHVELCENERGRFLRITEESHGHRNHVIIPVTGLSDFATCLEQVVATVDRAV